MINPLVSIIIPTYNRVSYIGETLNSVLNQTYTNWECIIIDDGSADNTYNTLKDYRKKDSRFKCYKRPEHLPKGANACRNYGINKSKGKYIQFLDSDDLMASDKIELQMEALNKNHNTSIATCRYGFFKDDINKSNIKNNEAYCKSFKSGFDLLNAFGVNGGYFPPHVYLFDRDILKQSGYWNEDLMINQDGEFFCRVLLNCTNVVYVDEAIVYYRTDSGFNTSTSKSEAKMANRIESWKLINDEIYNKTKVKNSLYVKKAKEIMFKTMFRDNPKLIYANGFFFRSQIVKHLLWYNPISQLAKRIIKPILKQL